mgnify:FL=1
MSLNIIITNSNDTPIFMQIKDSIKKSIFNDTLKEGESLPSVRTLASDLKISFLTVKRAYDELEKEGFIKTIPGKGSFISPKNLELIREEKLKEIEKKVEEIYDIAKLSNIKKEEVKELFEIIFEEEPK